MGRFDSVLFDLFGTLVPSYPPEGFRRSLEAMAARLGVPDPTFHDAWSFETWSPSTTDVYETIEANVRAIFSSLSESISECALRDAVEIRIAFSREALRPREFAIDVLAELKSQGFPLGLVSDCSAEIPALWPETALAKYFDATAFSCVVGAKKPDPKMYQSVCQRLEVAPERCLYVGDGFSRELSGARRLGMEAVLFEVPPEPRERSQTNEAANWDGKRVNALRDVIAIANQP